jgi:hypothetical protein
MTDTGLTAAAESPKQRRTHRAQEIRDASSSLVHATSIIAIVFARVRLLHPTIEWLMPMKHSNAIFAATLRIS